LDEISLDDGIEIALTALHADRLALLCGAGLSMADPSNLPNAPQLASEAKRKHDAQYGATRPPLPAGIVPIEIEVIIVGLTDEQKRHFRPHLEFWNGADGSLIEDPPIEALEEPAVEAALRIGFVGRYDPDEDDFKAETFFCAPLREDGEHGSGGRKRPCRVRTTSTAESS
jgi:hypothetical protein